MKFYTAWVDEGASFDANLHQKADLSVIEAEISHKEGRVPLLKIKTTANFEPSPLKRRLFFSGDSTLLFDGILLRTISVEGSSFLLLTFMATSGFEKEDLKKFFLSQKETAFFDPLFYREVKESDYLEGGTSLLHWSRVSTQRGLSDIIKGRKHIALGQRYYDRPLSIKIKQIPFQKVSVTLEAEWMQRHRGTVDLFPVIESAFPGRKMNSYTPLHNRWWEEGMTIGPYTIRESSLSIIHQEKQRSDREIPDDLVPCRNWYKGTLLLDFYYKQKRREIVTFSLESILDLPKGLPLHVEAPFREKKLSFKLNHTHRGEGISFWEAMTSYEGGARIVFGGQVYTAIEAHTSSNAFDQDRAKWELFFEEEGFFASMRTHTYFATKRGKDSLAYAVERARAVLLFSSRALEITFKTTLDAAIHIDCDTTLGFELRGEQLEGKVISYGLTMAKGKKEALIKVALPIAKIKKVPASQKGGLISPSGIAISGLEKLSPSGLLSGALDASFFAKDIQIKNAGEEQAHFLERNGHRNPQFIIATNPTDISLSLRDLRPFPCLEHKVELQLS